MNYDFGVLIIMPNIQKGGAEKQFSFLINAFKGKGLEHYVIFSEISDYIIINYFHVVKQLITIYCNYKPQIAIVYDVYGKYAIPILKCLGIKIIYSERNNGKHRLWIGRRCISSANILVANSKVAIKNMKEYVDSPVEYIPNGVNLKEFSRNIEKPISRVLVPSRIHPSKHQHMIIDVAKKCPDMDFYLFGKIDDKQYYKKIARMLEESGLNNVHYMGYKAGLENEFHEYDLVLLVSENEGNSNAILEAFANEVLCVATGIDSNKELIRDDSFVFENTTDSIVHTLKQVVSMGISKKRTAIQENRKFVECYFSVEKMCEGYIDLIKKLR